MVIFPEVTENNKCIMERHMRDVDTFHFSKFKFTFFGYVISLK